MPDAGDVTAKFLGDPSGFLDAVAQVKEALAGLGGGAFGGGGVDLGDTFAKGAAQATTLADAMQKLAPPTVMVGEAIGRLGTSLKENIPQIEQGGAALSGMVTAIAEEAVPRLEALAPSLHETMGQIAQSLQIPGAVEGNIVDQWNRLTGAIQDQATIQIPPLADALHLVDEPLKSLARIVPSITEQLTSAGLGGQELTKALVQLGQVTTDVTTPLVNVQEVLDKAGEAARNAPFTNFMPAENLNSLQNLSNYAQRAAGSISSLGIANKETQGNFASLASVMEDTAVRFPELTSSAELTDKQMSKLGVTIGSLRPTMESGGIGEAFSALGRGIDEFLRPLMYLQMGAQLVGSLATGMYNAAVIAEGPAAHGVGTFTGTVDALGVAFQKSSAVFSEAFGQGIMPTLNALNNQLGGGGQTGGFGGFLGFIGSNLANAWMLGTGLMPLTGIKGEINLGASLLGLQQPFTGPSGGDIQTQLAASIAQIPQQIQLQTVQMHAEATNPAFLQAQAQLTAAQTLANTAITSTVTYREDLIAASNPSSARYNFGPPTPMGQFSSPYPFTGAWAEGPPPQYYAPPPPIVGPGTTYMPGPQQQSPIITGAIDIGKFIMGASKSIWDFISGEPKSLWNFVSTESKSLWNFISGEPKSIWNFITGEAKSIWDFISGGGGPPSFATGVSNFSGGLAYVHSDELLYLPPGSSVYPNTGSGAGGGSSAITPIAMGGGGGPQTISLMVQLDSQALLTAQGIPLASTIRLYNGSRSG